MVSRRLCACALALFACAQIAVAQQVPLVQPGAPGQPNKVVTNTVGTAVKDPTPADFAFMQGMVMHHSQAVEMVGLMQGRTTNPDMLDLGKRIRISQGDEILFMKRWLAFFGKPVQDGDSMAGMDHSKMAMNKAPDTATRDTPTRDKAPDTATRDTPTRDMATPDMDTPMMPGMLSPRQMAALRSATGAQFEHLFLTGMIQHHTGALSMVKDLFDTGNGGTEPQLFDFTADVDVTQRGEIGLMQDMLAKEKH